VSALIREYRPEDDQAVVELSLRAWAPVFASIEQALGRDPGHGPARRVYEKAGYTGFPVVRYFKAL
jgi:hypothetical protein